MNEADNNIPQLPTSERKWAEDGAILVSLGATLADLEVAGMGEQAAVRAVINKLNSGDDEHILVQDAMRATGYDRETVVSLLLDELNKLVKEDK